MQSFFNDAINKRKTKLDNNRKIILANEVKLINAIEELINKQSSYSFYHIADATEIKSKISKIDNLYNAHKDTIAKGEKLSLPLKKELYERYNEIAEFLKQIIKDSSLRYSSIISQEDSELLSRIKNDLVFERNLYYLDLIDTLLHAADIAISSRKSQDIQPIEALQLFRKILGDEKAKPRSKYMRSFRENNWIDFDENDHPALDRFVANLKQDPIYKIVDENKLDPIFKAFFERFKALLEALNVNQSAQVLSQPVLAEPRMPSVAMYPYQPAIPPTNLQLNMYRPYMSQTPSPGFSFWQSSTLLPPHRPSEPSFAPVPAQPNPNLLPSNYVTFNHFADRSKAISPVSSESMSTSADTTNKAADDWRASLYEEYESRLQKTKRKPEHDAYEHQKKR